MKKLHEIHYIAGLLEGEGCFGFYDCPVIQVHMTDLEPLQRARNIMCPNVRIRVQNNKRGGRKTMYILHFSGQLAIEWMMTLYVLMSPRRKERINNIISEWKAMSQAANHIKMVHSNRTRNYTSIIRGA